MPYIVSYIILTLTGLYKDFNESERAKRYGLIVVWISLSLLFGLRGYANEMPDTLSYKWTYTHSVFVSSISAYLAESGIDFVYYGINWILAHLGISWQVYLMLFAMFTTGVVLKFMDTYSEMPFLSIMIFMCFLFPAWESAMRQGMAMSFLYLAYMAFDHDKKKTGYLLFLLGLFSHLTVVFFVPFFFIRKIRISNLIILAYLGLTAIVYAFNMVFLSAMNYVAAMLGRNTYPQVWHERPTNFIIFVVLLLIFALILFKHDYNSDPGVSECIHAMFCAVILLAFGGGTNLRLVYYYAFFACILIPKIVKCIRPNQIAKIIVGAVFVLAFLGAVDTTYWFFWQDFAVG